MKVTNKEELAYVMAFYQLREFPLFHQGGHCGKIVRTKDGISYEKGNGRYFTNDDYAFSVAFSQVNDVVDFIGKKDETVTVTAVYQWEEMTWTYAENEGDPVTHHVYPRTLYHSKEEKWTGTYDEVFVKMEEANRHLRYCNGHAWSFKDDSVRQLHRLWYGLLSEGRKFDLYYGGGIVD